MTLRLPSGASAAPTFVNIVGFHDIGSVRKVAELIDSFVLRYCRCEWHGGRFRAGSGDPAYEAEQRRHAEEDVFDAAGVVEPLGSEAIARYLE